MRFLKLLLICVLVVSCNTDDDAQDVTSENLEFLVIADGILNGAVDVPEQNIVIANTEDWENLIDLIDDSGNSSEISEIDIDFSVYMVVGVIDQLRISGGYDKFISSINKDEFVVTVNVSSTEPEGNATTVITQPYQLVKIEKVDLPINFE